MPTLPHSIKIAIMPISHRPILKGVSLSFKDLNNNSLCTINTRVSNNNSIISPPRSTRLSLVTSLKEEGISRREVLVKEE